MQCSKTKANKNSMGLHILVFVLKKRGLIKFFNFMAEDMSSAVYISQPIIIFSCKWLIHLFFRDRHNK